MAEFLANTALQNKSLTKKEMGIECDACICNGPKRFHSALFL